MPSLPSSLPCRFHAREVGCAHTPWSCASLCAKKSRGSLPDHFLFHLERNVLLLPGPHAFVSRAASSPLPQHVLPFIFSDRPSNIFFLLLPPWRPLSRTWQSDRFIVGVCFFFVALTCEQLIPQPSPPPRARAPRVSVPVPVPPGPTEQQTHTKQN